MERLGENMVAQGVSEPCHLRTHPEHAVRAALMAHPPHPSPGPAWRCTTPLSWTPSRRRRWCTWSAATRWVMGLGAGTVAVA